MQKATEECKIKIGMLHANIIFGHNRVFYLSRSKSRIITKKSEPCRGPRVLIDCGAIRELFFFIFNDGALPVRRQFIILKTILKKNLILIFF